MSQIDEFKELISDYQIMSGVSSGMYPRANAAIAFRQMKALETIAAELMRLGSPPQMLTPALVVNEEGPGLVSVAATPEGSSPLMGRRHRPRFEDKAGGE